MELKLTEIKETRVKKKKRPERQRHEDENYAQEEEEKFKKSWEGNYGKKKRIIEADVGTRK